SGLFRTMCDNLLSRKSAPRLHPAASGVRWLIWQRPVAADPVSCNWDPDRGREALLLKAAPSTNRIEASRKPAHGTRKLPRDAPPGASRRRERRQALVPAA